MKKINIKDWLLFLFAISFTIFIIKNPNLSAGFISEALKLCVFIIIPAVLPFVLITKILSLSKTFNSIGNIFYLPRRLLKISAAGFNSLFIGLIGGFPNGALYIVNRYKNKQLSKNESEILLGFVNSCSISFCISVIGIFIFNNLKIGLNLFFIQSVSLFITYIVYGIPNKCKDIKFTPQKQIYNKNIYLTDVIKESILPVFNICMTVIFFYYFVNVFFQIIKNINLSFINEIFETILFVFFEISSGAKKISGSHLPFDAKYVITGVMMAWSGLSVHLQVISAVRECSLSLKHYFTIKTINVIITLILTSLTVPEKTSSVFYTEYYQPINFIPDKDFYIASLIVLAITSAVSFIIIGVIWFIIYILQKRK